MKQLPKDLVEMFRKYPNYFKTESSIHFDGHGFGFTTVPAAERVPQNKQYNAWLSLNEKLATKLSVIKKSFDKADSESKALKRDIEAALTGLRSFAQIQKQFPEAVPYLPKSTGMELMVNLDDIRKKLK